MKGKELIGIIHRWLGLASGLVVFIVALTGALYAFQAEIQDLTQPWRFVDATGSAPLPPSRIRALADQALPNRLLHSVHYLEAGRSVVATYYAPTDTYYYGVYVDPYRGQVLRVVDFNQTFFRWVLNGHYYLWLPPAIGQPLVASATLVFVLLLLSGLVLWWPKNRKGVRQRLTVNWSARWRRVNYDLHTVVGFYALTIGLLLGLTGLVWGFRWVASAMYWSTSGGAALVDYAEPASDTSRSATAGPLPIDQLWQRVLREQPGLQSVEVHFPATPAAPVLISTNTRIDNTWQTDHRFFDQYTQRELAVNHPYGRYRQATVADKIARLNYDVHTGAVLGWPGKLLMCLASLVCASLPVSGALIWWGRRNKKKPGSVRAPGRAKRVVV